MVLDLKPSASGEGWVLRLIPFKYKVCHVPSSRNIADCLSLLITTREIERASVQDEEMTEVRRCWKTVDWSDAPSPYRLLRDEITVVGRLLRRGACTGASCVAISLRERVLELAHEGHQGIVKAKYRLRSKVWWPNMNSVVERHCKKCLEFQAVNPVATMAPVKTTTMPTKPWRDLAVDLMDPLPTGESLLVTVDSHRRWIDVVRNAASRGITRCLENHFTRHGIPEILRVRNQT